MHSGLDNTLKRSAVTIVTLFLFLFGASVVRADGDFKIVSSEELKAMIDQKKEFVLVDARTKEEYQEAHIIGAISVPEKEFSAQDSLLPADENALMVFYCNGVKCGKSKKLAKKAAAAGYTNIILYADGFPVWEEKGFPIVPGPEYGSKIETTKLTPAEVKGLLDSGKDDYVIVDVRDEAEYKEGHIPAAISIPAEVFASRAEILPKEKKIIVYCNTGSRSYMAYRKLGKLAYPHIYQALFAEWKEASMPVEK